MREGSRRGSALIPQGAARHSPGWLRQRGRREAGCAAGRERGGVERVRQQRPAVAERRNYTGGSESGEGGDGAGSKRGRVHRVTEANSVRANQCRWLRDVTKVAGNKTVTTSLCSSVQNFSQLRAVMMFLTSPSGTSKVINLVDIDL